MAGEEEVAALKAELALLRAEIGALRAPAAGPVGPVGPADPGEEEWQFPPLILLLDGEAYQDELQALTEWVEGVLVPGMLGEVTHDQRWCHLWLEHGDPVIGPLHALWLAWQELTDPVSCGLTGPAVWYRDHYRPIVTELRSSTGPFAGCTKNDQHVVHRLPGTVPSAWNRPDAEPEPPRW